MTYFKKQPKKTRAIYLNTQDAYYINEDRTKFSFKIPNGINVEDESLLYVKNTTIDYNTSGLSVKSVEASAVLDIRPTTSTYNDAPQIIFTPTDGKGSGATAVGVLQGGGITASDTTTTTALGVAVAGSGYYGDPLNYISTFTDTGNGASVLPTISTSFSSIATSASVFPTISGTTGGAIAGTNERWIQFPYSGGAATMDYTFTTTEPLYCNVLVVGGGGSGGLGHGGGGGGAGAVIFAEKRLFPAGNFIVRVGRGAASNGNTGDDTSVSYNGVNIFLAKGGGKGVNFNESDGGAGGSGGGGSGDGTTRLGGVAVSTNIPANIYGNNGGMGGFYGTNTQTGGGGGGAGSAGGSSCFTTAPRAGDGGNGLSFNMTGTPSFFAAGGGGGGYGGGTIGGIGGSGIGGGGGNFTGGGGGAGSTGSGGGGGGRSTVSFNRFNGGPGGSGVVIIRYYASATATGNGSFTAGTITAGGGYTEIPNINIPPPPPTVPATFGATPINASTGTITACPDVLNPTLNGFYNAGTFTVGFQNNPVIAQGFCNTNASGGLTNIIITNPDDNGYYSSSAPLTITSINGIMLGEGFGVGLTYTPTYTGGRCVSVIITNAGTGYGNNLAEAPITFSYPSAPSTLASITGKTIVQGQLIALSLGSGGAGYKNPSIFIDPVSISPPIQAVFNPVYLMATQLEGVRMINHGRGYTTAPLVSISTASRVTGASGDLPLTVKMTPTNLVQPNYYYTIKGDGFSFNRTLYTNQDNKGMPTIAICSTNEMINNEDYIELVLPSQVINDITLEIKERDGTGLGQDQNLTTLIEITELDDKDVWFDESKRQEY